MIWSTRNFDRVDARRSAERYRIQLRAFPIRTSVAVAPPRGASVPPALIAQRRLPTTISLSKLNHAARAFAVYASQLSFPLSRSYGHARLVANLCRAGVTTPQGPE
jgi:hypothetical protein